VRVYLAELQAAAAAAARGTGFALSSAQIGGISASAAAAAALLLAAGAWALRSTAALTHRSLLGRVLPPGLGPETTLVVTDVQVRGAGAT
jgi:hypothetical protein